MMMMMTRMTDQFLTSIFSKDFQTFPVVLRSLNTVLYVCFEVVCRANHYEPANSCSAGQGGQAGQTNHNYTLSGGTQEKTLLNIIIRKI